ncbi:amphiphysin isoform X19 [Labrus mixtus]|uniref:amphiphysin isoform X19 n=1 Tax=Labrus mixtus TaxID=508554 RepID=UPI0029C00241|nr:amphiphysin isoform X19 [Labrus mixtus]
MAEIKTGIFAKNVQKRLNRAQEKVLQKLGKADETKDEQFEQVVVNFRRQESEGSRLQREMKSYMAAIKGMQQASINLTQSLHEVYEPDWHGKDDVMVIGKDSDALWEDFHNKLVDSTLLNLDAYLQQFPDLKTRVAKRSRKLIDYDSARHHVETLQVSGMKSDRKMMKADDELRKAQKVFDELNVGLQDELPTLWDSRVGFYISTYKSVTSLEAKFHREISLVCRQLYEVMTQLAEQHSDKMFTIQGAPSDSGPLRLARTPSPPEDESPPESPDASANHMLRPVSPGPPRPKSPTQLKKGPPVPPPPKATPSKEVAEEQIIDLFGGEFLPAPSPSQPNERPGESLLDLDFDAFQPDDSVSPIPQTAVPWDMWSADAETAPPAADDGFVANWSADFGSLSPNEDAASGAEASAAGLEGAQGGAQGQDQGLNQVKGWKSEDSEAVRSDEDEVGKLDSGGYGAGQEDRRKSTPGLVFTNEFGQEIEDSTADKRDKWSRSPDGSGSEYETAEEWGDGIQGGGWASADDELSSEDPPANTSEGWEGGGEDVATESYRPAKEQQSELTSDSTGHSITNTTQGGGAFDLSTVAETQGRGAFDLSTVAETQGGGAFDLSTVAETQGRGAFDLSTVAETQGRGAFDLSTVAETQGGGAFDSDPFVETQGGGAFDSDPFAEIQGGGAFDLSTATETQGGGAFDSDPFAETQGGGAFDLSTATETQGGGAFDSDPFAETQGGDKGNDFELDPFAESSEGGEVVDTSDSKGGWDSDPFAQGFPVVSSGTGDAAFNVTSWQEANVISSSSVTGENSESISGEAADMIKDANVSRIHKEPENSDMSEDEAANRRLGKLYQELDTEKEEATDAFNGFSQDSSAPSFFADFDKMNEVNTESTEATEASQIDKPPVPPAGEEPATPSSDEETAAPPTGEEPAAPPVVEEPAAPPTGEETPAPPAGEETPAPPAEEEPAAPAEDETAAPPAGQETPAPPAEEEPAAPLSVEEPADPPAGEEIPVSPAREEPESFVNPKDEELDSAGASPGSEQAEIGQIPPTEETSPAEATSSEKMPIPSVVIEPASSNEGDDDRDADIISPVAISDNGVTAENPAIKHMSSSGGVLGLPDDFLYKVETMHDFEAANSDELELKRGDVVLVVPTASLEDQDAGWLTGIRESDWLTLGAGAQKGLFPENFIQRLE